MPNDSANDNHGLNEAAAGWLIRLSDGDLAPDERARFEAWLHADPAHADALHRAKYTWGDMAHVDENRIERAARRPSRRRMWRALAASVALVFALGAWHITDPLTAITADHRTGFGEVRQEILADGSTVYLNTTSAIVVDFDADARRVTLLKGEASFDVVPLTDTEHRPFVVAALGGTARALGTRYTVRVDDERVRVAVEEHRVAVAPPSGLDKGTELDEGESVYYTARGKLGAVTRFDAAHAAAWRRGRLVFDRQPLEHVVAELNRYRAGRIVIADGALAAHRVSGVFHLDDLSRAVDVIADELGARAVSVPPLVTVIF